MNTIHFIGLHTCLYLIHNHTFVCTSCNTYFIPVRPPIPQIFLDVLWPFDYIVPRSYQKQDFSRNRFIYKRGFTWPRWGRPSIWKRWLIKRWENNRQVIKQFPVMEYWYGIHGQERTLRVLLRAACGDTPIPRDAKSFIDHYNLYVNHYNLITFAFKQKVRQTFKVCTHCENNTITNKIC